MILDKYFLDQATHRHSRPVHSKFCGSRRLQYSKRTPDAQLFAVRMDLTHEIIKIVHAWS